MAIPLARISRQSRSNSPAIRLDNINWDSLMWLRRIADAEYLRRYGWEPSVIRNEKEYDYDGNGAYIDKSVGNALVVW